MKGTVGPGMSSRGAAEAGGGFAMSVDTRRAWRITSQPMGDNAQDEVVAVRARGLRWLAVAGFADALPALDVDRTRRPEEPGRDELIKSSTVRIRQALQAQVRDSPSTVHRQANGSWFTSVM
jgi:hypothetical protein